MAGKKNDSIVRKRIFYLMCSFILVIVFLLTRIVKWQIVEGDELKRLAQLQWSRELTVEAYRGNIVDKNYNPLAVSVSCYTIILQPSIIKDNERDSLIQNLSEILEMDYDEVNIASQKNELQVILKYNVSAEQAETIRFLKYKYTTEDGKEEEKSYSGVLIRDDMQRVYPMGDFLTQVLGFTTIDGMGIEGIESRFDKYLRGENGSQKIETDGAGNKIPGTYEEIVDAVDGYNVQLTIDMALQSFAESALDKCITEQQAKSAICVVMDPKTGDILALVNKPDFDNNEPPRYDASILTELSRNRAITDVYEPGSTFKLVTTAAAIDSGTVNEGSTFTCVGYKIVDGQKISCWSDKPHGTLNLTGAVQNSCNPAFMTMGLGMGKSLFYDYIYDFGFGSETGVKMHGESSGIVTNEKYVKNVDLARISFGQAIAVTPLQLVTAVSAIVNGGDLMEPRIVKSIYSNEGTTIETFENEVVRQVISPQTSDIMRDIMTAVVDGGSGRNAQIDGYNIGGKTGTAQKYDENGAVLHDKHISSFIAAAPMEDPQLVVLIAVDEPTAGLSYGSIVAAPYVREFLEQALPYINVHPDNRNIDTGVTIATPNVVGLTFEEAHDVLKDAGLGCIQEGFSGKIVTQIPGADADIKKGSSVIVQVEQVTNNGEDYLVEVPDLFGLTPLEAIDALSEANLDMTIENSGNFVSDQYPREGDLVVKGSKVTVSFDYHEILTEEDEEETDE